MTAGSLITFSFGCNKTPIIQLEGRKTSGSHDFIRSRLSWPEHTKEPISSQNPPDPGIRLAEAFPCLPSPAGVVCLVPGMIFNIRNRFLIIPILKIKFSFLGYRIYGDII